MLIGGYRFVWLQNYKIIVSLALFSQNFANFAYLKTCTMPNILKVNSPGDYISYVGGVCSHPLIGVIDFDSISPIPQSLNRYEVYGLFMHRNIPNDLIYGCGKYDYRSGTLICVAPGQIGGREDNGGVIDLDGWALLFHPDLLKASHL